METFYKPKLDTTTLVNQLYTQTFKEAESRVDKLFEGLSALNEKDFYLVYDFLIEKKILHELYGAFPIFVSDYVLLHQIEKKELWSDE